MSVSLLHFEQPYQHARHYLGSAQDVAARLQRHRTAMGARLMEVITQAGISWPHARRYRPDGMPQLERALKLWQSDVRLCPTCRQEQMYRRALSRRQEEVQE